MPWKRSLPSWSLCANGRRQTADLNSTYMRHFPIVSEVLKSKWGNRRRATELAPFFRAVSEGGALSEEGCSSGNRAELL